MITIVLLCDDGGLDLSSNSGSSKKWWSDFKAILREELTRYTERLHVGRKRGVRYPCKLFILRNWMTLPLTKMMKTLGGANSLELRTELRCL